MDVTTLGATLIYGMISHAVFRHARAAKLRREQGTGLVGLILMGGYLVLLLIPGLLPFQAMETESCALFIAWAVLGLAARDIFDPKTARHFDDDDRIALSMETPYIYCEDVPPAAWPRRRAWPTSTR